MIKLLSYFLIPDCRDYENPRVRTSYGILSGSVSIVLNLLLFIVKWLAGNLSGSVAIVADAFNNLSDAGSSVVTLIGFRISSQDPDEQHPFGHGRMEYISGFIVSVAIILMGFELLQTSLSKVLHPEELSGSPLTIMILVLSIGIKLYMYFYNHALGKKLNSTVMTATAMDSLSDTAATSIVLVSTLICLKTNLPLDGYMGLLVSCFIFYTGIRTMKEMIDPLLGQPPKQELIDEIRDIVLSHSLVYGMHDLIVHDYGPNRKMISLHAEVPANGNILEIHEQIDHIEEELNRKLHCESLIHMDPIVTDDEETARCHMEIEALIHEVNPEYSVHDFRMVKKMNYVRVFFDLSVPYNTKQSDEIIQKSLQKKISDRSNGIRHASIHIDRCSSDK